MNMKENSVGTLLWKDRITESVMESKSSFTIRLMVPVVWMIPLDKTSKDDRWEIKQKINKHLSKIIEKQTPWDVKKYDWVKLEVGDLKKDFVDVVIILEKKVV